jgi:hypothetical protein
VKKSKGRNQKHKKLGTAKRKTNKQILPALAAVGGACGLAVTPASALELGDIRVDSALGQPLRASIAYALAPNEQMFDFCIFLKPGMTANGMPVISNARVTITGNAIVLNGRMPIKEPLLAMQLSVNCPYTAHLARDYTLMIDPPLPSEGERAVLSTERPPMTPVQRSTVTESDLPVAVRPRPVPRRSTRRPQDETPIAARSRYLVQQGDSLSQIVARIEERTMPLWPAVNAIFEANPDAFLDNDPNLLKAGSWLDIPDLTDAGVVTTLASSQPVTEPVSQTPTATAYPGAAIAQTETAIESEAPAEVATAVESAQDQSLPKPLPQPAPTVESTAEPELIAEVTEAPEPVVEPVEVPTAATPQLRPGDFVIGTDNPFVVPVGSDDAVIDIPDSELRGPQVAQPVPSVAVTNEDEGGISGGWAWLLWLGGAGLAMILGLFIFGRQLREYFGSVPDAVPAVPQRRSDDAQARPTIADVDYNFDATTITGHKISLDADLADGTGLQESDEMDVAQDFAFSATESEIDMEIPELPVEDEELPSTDIMPAQASEDATILDSEVLPTDKSEEEDDEDYSVSMNVDATKQILDDNTATTKDLQAIMVDTTTDIIDDDTSEYSLSKSAEYQILEQDYEEELTATQALNKEIEAAARALAVQMDEAEGKDKTSEMPAPQPQDPDMTAELTANLEAPGDAQNEEFGDTGGIPDLMVEMPESDSDETLDVESPVIESEKKEASSG